jgi:pyrroloquinoline-quinone synthase
MAAWTPAEFHQQLLAAGELNRRQLQMWVANRYYYQANIPRKDAAILANCPDREFRRRWLGRILDQDGTADGEGGLEAWLRLGEGAGLTRAEILDQRHVVAGVRFAVDAYVNFARTAPWQEAVCASLTELFAPEAHQRRLEAFPKHYSYVPASALEYFRRRQGEARRDVDHGLTLTLSHFITRPLQERALEILNLKLDVLWGMAEAIYRAYVAPEFR